MNLRELDQFENVVATGRAKMVTDIIWPNVCEYVVLILGGTSLTKAMLTQIIVKMGKKQVMEFTGTQLQSMNSYDVDGAPLTHLFIPFYNSRARTLEQQYAGAPDFGALGLRELTIEVQITGATAPTLTAKASIVPQGILRAGAARLCRTILRTQLNPAAAVTEQAQSAISLGAHAGMLVRRIHFFSALVTQLRVKRNSSDIYEKVTLADNNAILTRTGHVPQANIFTLDAIEDDNELKWMTTLQGEGAQAAFVPMQILMNTSAGGAFDVLTDGYADPNLI